MGLSACPGSEDRKFPDSEELERDIEEYVVDVLNRRQLWSEAWPLNIAGFRRDPEIFPRG